MGRLWALMGLVATVGSSVGCGDNLCASELSCDVCPTITEPASVEIGAYDYVEGFVEIADGDEVDLFHWYHFHCLEVSVRTRGIYPGTAGDWYDPNNPTVTVDAYWQGMLIARSLPDSRWLDPAEDGTFTGRAMLAPSGATDFPSESFEDRITLTARVDDACGRTATSQMEVVLHCVQVCY